MLVTDSDQYHIEISDRRRARLITIGGWLDNMSTPQIVQVFAINYDYHYEIEKGSRDPNERPQLNHQGEQYVVLWQEGDFFAATESPSSGFMTLNEARLYAQSVVNEIDWSVPFTSNYI